MDAIRSEVVPKKQPPFVRCKALHEAEADNVQPAGGWAEAASAYRKIGRSSSSQDWLWHVRMIASGPLKQPGK
jgi:hypothetical protein